MSTSTCELEITAAFLFVHAVNITSAIMDAQKFFFILVCFNGDVLFVETKLYQQSR